MLRSKIYSSQTIFWSQFLSFILSPYFLFLNFFRLSYDYNNLNIKKILVTEYHRIGDILLIGPAMEILKKHFPDAKIILLCNHSSVELAKHLNMADNIIPFRAPWTEWDWSLIKWFHAWSFARKLSKKNIDLAFDFKGDFRNSWFLWNVKPKINFGYINTGGKYFYSHPKEMNEDLHQTFRANELLYKAGCDPIYTTKKNRLNNTGAIVFHIGAGDPRRFWPIAYWFDLTRLLSEKFRICIVKTTESLELIKLLKDKKIKAQTFSGTLVELSNWLAQQRCIIAPDSMAGHLAAHVGIPVVSIFGSQSPELTSPLSDYCRVVTPESPCSHSSKHWRLCKLCMESISPAKVESVVYSLLSANNINH